MFHSLDIISQLHAIVAAEHEQCSVEQVAASVSYFSFMVIAKQNHGLFGAEWTQRFPQWKEWESFSVVSRLFRKEHRFVFKSEVAALQNLGWPGLSMLYPMDIPASLLSVMSHDRFQASLVYAMLCYKSLFVADLSAYQLVKKVQQLWNEGVGGSIYETVMQCGMNI